MVARKGITSKYYCIEMFSFVGYNIYHGNSVSPASASVYCSSIKKNYIISLKNKKERRIRNTNEHTNTYMHAQTKISAVLPENAVEAHDSVDSHMTWKIAAYWNAHTHTHKQAVYHSIQAIALFRLSWIRSNWGQRRSRWRATVASKSFFLSLFHFKLSLHGPVERARMSLTHILHGSKSLNRIPCDWSYWCVSYFRTIIRSYPIHLNTSTHHIVVDRLYSGRLIFGAPVTGPITSSAWQAPDVWKIPFFFCMCQFASNNTFVIC